MSVTLVVHLDISPSAVDEFAAIVRRHAEYTLAAEQGCIEFRVLRAEEPENRFILLESYRDEAALAEHFASPHMQRYLEDSAALVTDRRRYRCTAG
jgi:quinol monooxygenase YgiN